MKVLVLKGDSYHEVATMFAARGWETTFDPDGGPESDKVDLVCFTGGADVSPYLYGEENISSYCDPVRDEFERQVYEQCFKVGIPMVGICRGGQFLNVMNGGKMIQHVGPYSGDIKVKNFDGNLIEVRVDHHQGIVCKYAINVDAWTDDDNACHYWGYFPQTMSMFFQPHPEWGHQGTEDLFFEYLKDTIGL